MAMHVSPTIKQRHFWLSWLVIVSLLPFCVDIEGVLAETLVSSTPSLSVNASSTFSVSSTPTEEVSSTPERPLIPEPTIRVGLYKTNQVVLFRSDFPYEVFAGMESQGLLEARAQAKLDYDGGVYRFSGDGVEFATTTYVRLVPSDLRQDFFTLVSYDRRVAGRKNVNFNVYRGVMEYRYSPRSKLPYIINELPLESYVRGIAESADSAPEEYAKALLTAARTYAYTHISSDAPTTSHLFDVYATTFDQIYLGYNSEVMMPHIVVAAVATAGEMVTYHGAPVITLYFGHSSGHTRTWPGKGGRARPWLKSIKATYDKGRKMWGHGYGMSCHDAEMRAKKDGWTAEQILKYYYSGTEVEKVY